MELSFNRRRVMKKKVFIVAFMLAAVFSACQVKETVESPAAAPKMIEVRAVICDGELGTKTTLENGSAVFHWSDTDQIVAWNGTEATKGCEISNLDDSGNATFVVPEGTQWVVYPSHTVTVDGSVATWNRPITQTLSDGEEVIGDGANPMFGRLEGGVLKFTNLCGYIQFQLTGTKTLSKFSFKTNNITTPAISGQGNINVDESVPVLSYPVLSKVSTSGVSKYGYITVTGRNIALSNEPVSVYVVVPPATYEGSEIVMEFTDGTSAAVIASNDITVERNKVKKIRPINVDSLFPASPVALDENGRSNCYLVIAGSDPQYYSFTAQKIVSGEFFESAKVASLLWAESKTMVNNFTYDSNTHKVTFLYNGNNKEGNAVISIDENRLGTAAALLWNYQIWVTDQPEDIQMDETDMPHAILDRNVGATWAPKTEEEVIGMTKAQWLETVGTYYQYGNHIPYPRIVDAKNSSAAWDQYRVGVMYGFSNYCQRFAYSGATKATLAEQEQFPNYAYQKVAATAEYGGGKVKEQNWTQVELKGGPVGDGYDIWETSNTATDKMTDYDPCPQGYCFITATYTYQETVNNEVSDHLLNSVYAGKYNMDVSGHLMYFPAAGYLGAGKYALVGAGAAGGRVVYWSYFVSTTDNMNRIFRRNYMNQAQIKFAYDNQPFSSQAHNLRCRKLDL